MKQENLVDRGRMIWKADILSVSHLSEQNDLILL